MSAIPVQTLINTNAEVGGFSNIPAWEEMSSWGSATKEVPAAIQTPEIADEAMPLADEHFALAEEPMPPADDLPPAASEIDTPPRRSSKRAQTDLSAYRRKAAELQAAIDEAWKHPALNRRGW
jgi:hypothetical protein